MTLPETEHRPGRTMGPAARLALGALLAVTLLQGLFEVTREPIAEAKQRLLDQTLIDLLPADTGNGRTDHFTLLAPDWLGSPLPMKVYRRGATEHMPMVIEAVAPRGYAGDIRLLVGLDAPGQVRAARVIEHRETPGLGDAIEAEKSDWIDQFERRQRSPGEVSAWRVDKDGGDFDTLAGATITSRTLVETVQQVADLHVKHHSTLATAAPGSEVRLDRHASLTARRDSE
ncbi:RnfABCDGE type electron transport complex subunit G [Pseudomarimonas arenosa]|uniref:Ion-translocating oxidoreductase complex subunit G n=1 Tax=Pseudomarimonas arenosa TaxID=2774145 RepID=A0AAW3ZKK0_9GAMM|nr:RnfABCDGE type electron transport complex subunit G [Pseudomarimonas arenosa]MBD8526546.1 RnfABCDGE type electron transport complex subunit G [Pseudomarimonas arenosa]